MFMLSTRTNIDEEAYAGSLDRKQFTCVGDLLKDKFFLQHYFHPTPLNCGYWKQWQEVCVFNQELFSSAIFILNELKNLPRIRVAEHEIEATWTQLQKKQPSF